jgi:glycine hydroxymethyltransferase
VHQSGRFYRAFHYGVNPATGRIDYDRVQALAERHRPKLIVAGFSAYSRVVDWGRIRGIADGIGAYMLADVAHVAGLIAAGLYPSPVPIADVVTSTTHKTLRGPRGGLILAKAAKDLPERLDAGVFPGLQGGPLMHVVAAKAVAFKEATEPGFRVYCAQVVKNARAMAERCAARGYLIVSGGTDNHLFLIDLQERKLTGRVAAAWLREAGINVNECQVPADPEPEGVASGIRLGTPATTTRGLDETESATLADWVCDVLDARGDARVIDAVQSRARDWCDRHPIP